MKNLFKNIYLSVLFLFLSVTGYAQLYPVQLTPIFNSPYSVKISDYATSMDTKMQLLINPTDITISQRQVRLKLYIQGNGLNIKSSDFIQGQRPIFINGGELQTLTNTDIAALFRLENLQGISPAQYANPLPEGMYNFCFEMYDFVTNQKISQKSCASLYLILNDPPLLNTPQKNEQIASTEFPNILFTWTPRQINATNISYKFELKQLIDPTLDPQIGFQMSPILYEETLFGTALLYNLSMPVLTPGFRYAWRVKAISTTGLSENAVFKNDGYSEIYSFKYTASCAAPTFLLSESQSSKSVKITWEGIPEHTRYQLQYKKQDVRNAQWFSTNSLNTQSLITNLEPGVTYQFRVGSSCDPATEGVQSFTYSGISTFTTPTQTTGVPAYNCGIVPEINIQNQKPLTNLIQSETFKAGDFPVTILELQGENSPYSGRGYIVVPYLGDTKIAVEFNNIVINTDYQLISGVVETSYNPDWSNVVDVNKVVNDLLDSLSDAIDAIDDLLSKDKIDNQKEFNESWTQHVEIIETQKQLLFETGNLPEHMKDEITKMAGNTFIASTDKSKIPTQEDFPKAKEELTALKNIAASILETEGGLENLLMILKNLSTDSFIKCKQCEGQKIEKLGGFDGSKGAYHKFSYYNKAYICLIASLKQGKEISVLSDDLSKSSDEIAKARPEFASLIESTKSVFNTKQDLLAVISNNTELISCEVIYPFNNEICGGGNTVDNETLLNVGKELDKCYYSEYEPKLIAGTLKEITKNSRSDQGIEFVKSGKVYALNGNGEAEEVKNPLTDDDIRNGKWTDATIDVKLRVTQNKEGIFQYQAVGIRSNLTVAFKNVDHLKLKKDLAAHIESQGNLFFQKYKVIKADLTPAKAGVNLNNEKEVFADGEKIALDNNASFFKISAEGIGLLNTFLQTAEVEKPAYLTSTKNSTIIHAPGLVTGTVESGATVVTDITSLCSMVYDLSTDEKTRTDMYTGLVKLKDAVKDEPSGVIPIFVQMLSGNTNDEWAEIAKNQTDEGRKGHLYSRGVVTSVKSVLVGGALITKLPQLADDLVGKIEDVLKVGKKVFNSADEFANALYKARSDIRKGIINLTESRNLALEYFEHIKKTDLSLKNVKFDDWFENTFKKYEAGTPNFEAHHVIPADLLKSNPDFKQLIFDLHKADPDFKFDFNGLDNGIMLQKKSLKLDINTGHAKHDVYNREISKKISEIINNSRNVNKPERAFEEIQDLIKSTKEKLKNEVLLGNKDVNDIISF
jgi:hypothetical protein